MLRDLIAWVLNNYLGKYVGNLNTAQLTVALLSGEVELENLPLRRDALRGLGLPLQALSGTIGKIKLQVPMRQLRTAPWCISIERVHIVVGPYNLDDWDADVEEQADVDYKVARLDRLEAKWRAAREASLEGGYYASSYSGWMSYGTSIVTHVVENMQLKINDVHIRYEDSITVPNYRFACGITIDSLSAQSCDMNWQPGLSTTTNSSASFKLVELQSFNFYWDRLNNEERFSETSPNELTVAMNSVKWNHKYVISPVCAQAKLKQDRSDTPLRTRNRPRLVCDLVLNEVSLTLIDWQYNQMVECVRGLDDIAKFKRFRLLRPTQSIKEGARLWWIYACRCHGLLRDLGQRTANPSYMRDSIRYVKIYTKTVSNPNETLSAEDKMHKDEVERKRDYDELKCLREICMQTMPDVNSNVGEGAAQGKGRGMLLQWFPQWWGWYKQDGDGSGSVIKDGESTAGPSFNDGNQFEDDLLNALSVSVDTNSLLKRDAVFGKFDFTLKRGTLDICSGDPSTDISKPMLQLQFETLNLNVESRPRSGSHYVGLSLGSVYLKDRITQNTEFPDLVRPQQIKDESLVVRRSGGAQKRLSNSMFSVISPSSPAPVPPTPTEPLFTLQYERKPLLYNTDYRLFIKTQSLDIVYNTGAMRWLIDFASKPHQMVSARKKIEAMKDRTKKEFMKNWENILEGDGGVGMNDRKTWALEIDISAPQIIFVENFSKKNGLIVLMDFGRMQLSNGCTKIVKAVTSTPRTPKKVNVSACREADDSSSVIDEEDEDEEDDFVTPLSTPPGSTTDDSLTLVSALSSNGIGAGAVAYNELPEVPNRLDTTAQSVSEAALLNKIYDKYNIDLTELQVLVCKDKDGWAYASSKGTSSLHVLDRFNISLQIERRMVMTTDPQYPSLKLSGTLPKLVVHANEMKIAALTTMWNIFFDAAPEVTTLNRSPTASADGLELISDGIDEVSDKGLEQNVTMDSPKELSKLIIIQFAIDQMVLEVQSRGRGIAELQVSGVKAGFSKRPSDTNVTLSVHGLLLVDAIQSFGPDFELLIASHRHVGIDSVSGSLKQSEPCSPTSPGSPDPMDTMRRPTSPHTISKALNSLQRGDNTSIWDAATPDLDALITVEVLFVTPIAEDTECLQVANIQFNNLDIIANQETIVELIGFTKRVFPNLGASNQRKISRDYQNSTIVPEEDEAKKDKSAGEVPIRTEITFDFHRLNVLVLRAVMRDSFVVGRKVGTFTMSEARIHATLGDAITVEGSLGGLQVLDLTPEGINHQRILSVGKDPLTEPPNIMVTKDEVMSKLFQEMYNMGRENKTPVSSLEERQALSFVVSRDMMSVVDIRIRMASVWYTHCARFMQELNWCASEFAHYLKNLAKSIREKAADMALGLVQPRPEATPRTYLHHQSMDGGVGGLGVMGSPRRNLLYKSTPLKASNITVTDCQKVEIRLDVILDTPVLVVPRSSCSTQVFVAHLGQISVSNTAHNRALATGNMGQPSDDRHYVPRNDSTIFTISEEDTEVNDILKQSNEDLPENIDYSNNMFQMDDINNNLNAVGGGVDTNRNPVVDELPIDEEPANWDTYVIDVRNMNLFSLDTIKRKGFRMSALPRAEEFYSCKEDAMAVLHDTAIRLEIVRIVENKLELMAESNVDHRDTLQITGSVIQPFHLSLSKNQYEQLLETVDNLFKVPHELTRPPNHVPHVEMVKSESIEEYDGIMYESKMKRRLFDQPSMAENKVELEPKLSFSLPILKIELKDEKNVSMIDISFRDFNFDYEKNNQYETNVQVSLRSLYMEDLMQPIDSKNRAMVVSSSPDNQPQRPGSAFASLSCPNLVGLYNDSSEISASLPENLESRAGFFPVNMSGTSKVSTAAGPSHVKALYPETPPPSPLPRQNHDNLVLYSSLIVDPSCPTFETQYLSKRQSSSIDFNSLDLNVSVLSWFNLLDFFGLMSDDEVEVRTGVEEVSKESQESDKNGNTELGISIRSLTVVLVKPSYEIAKANVSNARFVVSKRGVMKMVEGSLGSMSLLDLSKYGQLYRERFVTSGTEALSFTYRRDQPKGGARSLQMDAELKIQMSSVRYVHTKRFVMDIQIFFKDFLQLQTVVLRKIKPTESRLNLSQRPTQLGLEIIAGSPIILLPMSYQKNRVIVADLGNFTLKNKFMFRDQMDMSKDGNGFIEILDVMTVDLVNTDLFAAVRHLNTDNVSLSADCLNMGGYIVIKEGPSFLEDKCQLKLKVDRNMDSWQSHNVPDFSVQGTLSSVIAVLNLEQYKLVRGFLTFNLGEDIDELYLEPTFNITDSHINLHVDPQPQSHDTWANLAITLDLQNVSVQLQTVLEDACTKLAKIDFIKSSLKIESFTDGSQDIDLVSQEILISDTRRSKNVFGSILMPISGDGTSCDRETFVQAEIYSRKKNDCSKYTILLNNMRLVAILDWLESVRDFLFQMDDVDQPAISAAANYRNTEDQSNENVATFELVLNITKSELVFVENPEQLDTNAVILRSTTILSYRPFKIDKVMSINLNDLEVFSCIMGAEESTAMSIIDPMTVNLDIRKEVMDIQLQKRLCIRLSYNDMKMFKKMLESLPQQTLTAREVSRDSDIAATSGQAAGRPDHQMIQKLIALDFLQLDCERALIICNNRLDEAALWLTQNAVPLRYNNRKVIAKRDPLAYNVIEISASYISICVIDDCKDADVPLLEFSLAKLELHQEMGMEAKRSPTSSKYKMGNLKGIFSSDYYNRSLSGWEPLIESWQCEAHWHYNLGQFGLHRNPLQIEICSSNQLNFNLTSTIIELYQQVRDNWMEDYYERDGKAMIVHRRRTPFVPFALKNETGLRLWFSTLVTSPGSKSKQVASQLIAVEPGQVIPFSFGPPTKLRHFDSHKLNLHQIEVRLDGWTSVGPVSVDRVGVYFRDSTQLPTEDSNFRLLKSRIVFSVTMEGSAQKLITVRSSLTIVNKMDTSVQIKLEHLYSPNVSQWPATVTAIVKANETYNIPVSHVHAFIYLRPTTLDYKFDDTDTTTARSLTLASAPSALTAAVGGVAGILPNGNDYWNKFNVNQFHQGNTIFQYSERSVHWREMPDNVDIEQEYQLCKSNRDEPYRILVAMCREKYPAKDIGHLPGHSLILYPPLRIHNLLPCDLMYRLNSGKLANVCPSNTANIYEVDTKRNIEINVSLEGYPGEGLIMIPAQLSGTAEMKFKVTDSNDRILILRASIAIIKGYGVQVSISTSYWLVNRTGLPLIFKQEGGKESSGQFSEHEQARLLTPLMFSFSDLDSPPALSIRLGKRYGNKPAWCQPINLQKNIQDRQLKSDSSNETFIVGLEVRRGRGRYAKTSVVTFSPRFQIYNRSSYKLQFAQKCFTTPSSDTLAKSTYIEAIPDCHLPFHWPRLDREQMLCVRLSDVPNCVWSGGIPINEAVSYYVNIRNMQGDMHFLRFEIVLEGAMYFLIFGDAQVLPPPIRIDNYSEVPIKFHQPDCKHTWRTTVKPRAAMAYVLDEPTGPAALQIEVHGGVSQRFSLREMNKPQLLTYENFVYIAFKSTFKDHTDLIKAGWDYDLEKSQLVLTVEDKRVVLKRKRHGDRSQLWTMNSARQLVHEGSSPPMEPGRKLENSLRYVLDLDKAPQPTQLNRLVVRLANKQRARTQTWKFTEEGRLMCEHANMCVQAIGGVSEMLEGSEAVLGMIVSDKQTQHALVPMEQEIERQKMLPGSGCLSIEVVMDGPIKTIRIRDIEGKAQNALNIDSSWVHVSHTLNIRKSNNSSNNLMVVGEQMAPVVEKNKSMGDLHLKLKLYKGLGLSIVSRSPYEELMFMTLENILLEYVDTENSRSVDFHVDDVQIDNQLLESPCPIMLYTTKQPQNDSPHRSREFAIQLKAKLLPSPNKNAVIFEYMNFSLCQMAILLEERLLLRMVDFMGLTSTQQDAAQLSDESEFEAQRMATNLMAANVMRYYFGNLQIVPSQNRVSVVTASKLTPRMAEIKKTIGLTLIKFEDAVIEFQPFYDRHHFETLEVYMRAIKSHYKSNLKWQAASILGSVDFLGNPSGFASDVSEGVNGLIFEGSVKSLVKNVTHGISNSTAKLTETISDGLGRVVLDEEDTEARQKILEVTGNSNSSANHLIAGVKGFGFGLLGGATSIVKHTYTGAQNDGLPGFFSGLGMGLVGMVTKPVIGVLDLASETANAVREKSRSSHRILPEKKRFPRCVSGAPGGLLPPFSATQGKGQNILLTINKRDLTEQLLEYEPRLFEQLRLLVSTKNVWVFTRNEEVSTIVFSYHLSDLISCCVQVEQKGDEVLHYIELCVTVTNKSMTSSTHEAIQRPKVRCQSMEIAQRASRHINYAKGIYDEREQTLTTSE